MKLSHLTALVLLAVSAPSMAFLQTANRYDVSNLNQDVIESRLSMSGPLFNGWNVEYKQGDPWAEAFGYTHRYSHQDMRNKGAGVVLGYDHVIADSFRVGLAINGGAGKLKITGEDGGSMDSRWGGANLYSTWKGQRVNVIANLGYLYSKDKPEYSHIKGSAINAGIRFETSFVAGGISWVPYYSVRFTHLHNNNFQDGDAETIHFGNQNIWQFPVGVNAGYEFTCGGGWRTRTALDLAVIPTAGQRKVTMRDATYSISERYADSISFRGKFGIETTKGQHAFGLKYGAGVAPHGSFRQELMANYQFMY